MSETKWTPGPWGWFGNTKHGFYLATNHSGRKYVMAFERKGMNEAQPVFRSSEGYMVKAEKVPIFEVCREAVSASDERVYRTDIVGFRNPDAHLIAAAPSLAEALENLLNQVIHWGDDRQLEAIAAEISAAESALALAKGETK